MFAETYFGFFLEHQSGSSKTCVTIPFGSIALNAEVASIFGDPATKTRPNHWEYEWTLDAKYADATSIRYSYRGAVEIAGLAWRDCLRWLTRWARRRFGLG